jgi:TRAP-type transport system periplasmic protein
MGATPVNITSPEIYEALQRGQVDCVMGPQPWLLSYSLWDMVKYVSAAKLGTYHGTNMLNINVDVWKKLDDAEKKAMVDNLAEAVADMARAYEDDDISIREEAEQKGIEWIDVDSSFTQAVEAFREKDMPRIVDLAKSRGVKNPEPNIALFRDNIAKWEKIVADIGEGEWGDAEWTKYQAAIQAEVYDKVEF